MTKNEHEACEVSLVVLEKTRARVGGSVFHLLRGISLAQLGKAAAKRYDDLACGTDNLSRLPTGNNSPLYSSRPISVQSEPEPHHVLS